MQQGTAAWDDVNETPFSNENLLWHVFERQSPHSVESISKFIFFVVVFDQLMEPTHNVASLALFYYLSLEISKKLNINIKQHSVLYNSLSLQYAINKTRQISVGTDVRLLY